MKPRYKKGLVSVIVPTYKRASLLSRTIESVLSQTYRNLELILVNDNDPNDEFTSNVKKITEIYKKDSRFKLVIQDRHINGAFARNIGIKEAQGEYIAFLDDDDWWEKTKLSVQVSELEKLDDSWGGVSCRFKIYNKNNEIISLSPIYKDGKIYRDILSMYTEVTTCSILLRREALDETGYFDDKLVRNQEIQLLANFTFKYKIKLVDKFLLNIDASDNQNRVVDEIKLLDIRTSLYKSVSNILNKISKQEFKTINSLRDIELAYILLKNGKYSRSLKYAFSMFNSPSIFILTFNLLLRRIKSALMKKLYV